MKYGHDRPCRPAFIVSMSYKQCSRQAVVCREKRRCFKAARLQSTGFFSGPIYYLFILRTLEYMYSRSVSRGQYFLHYFLKNNAPGMGYANIQVMEKFMPVFSRYG